MSPIKFAVLITVLALLGCAVEQPIRVGYATTYSSRVDSSPGIIFMATTRRGISLSDTHEPKKMKTYLDSCSKPAKPFYIRVYADHLTATDMESDTTVTVASGNVVEIDWKK